MELFNNLAIVYMITEQSKATIYHTYINYTELTMLLFLILLVFFLQYTAGTVGIAVSREIIQYHYTSWPDHGVPECPGPILDYLRRVKSGNRSGPILVHCR